MTNATVGKWRRRFVEQRILGLHDELRPGKPRSIDDERIARLLTTTLHHKPEDGVTHWSVRGLAAETGISKTSVHRFLQVFGLQPYRQDTFKLSTDPFFVEKLKDVVGLYLNPPDQALVLCVDEKSPRCLRDAVEERLFEARRDRFSELSVVFMETTSLDFEGAGGESLGQRAHSKDHHPAPRRLIRHMPATYAPTQTCTTCRRA